MPYSNALFLRWDTDRPASDSETKSQSLRDGIPRGATHLREPAFSRLID